MRFFGLEIRRSAAKKEPPVEFLGSLVKMDVLDGDVAVLMPARELSGEQAQAIGQTWEDRFGDRATLLVLDVGMRIGILAPDRAARIEEARKEAAGTDKAVDDFAESIRG